MDIGSDKRKPRIKLQTGFEIPWSKMLYPNNWNLKEN